MFSSRTYNCLKFHSSIPFYRQTPFKCSKIRYRSFHVSPRSNLPSATQLLDAQCTTIQVLFDSAHNSGLSWAFILPLSAVIVRSLIVLPFLTLPSRFAQQRQLDAQPIIQARSRNYNERLKKSPLADKPLQMKKAALTMRRQMQKKMAKDWGFQFWRTNIHFLQLPIFLTLTETIRRMIGSGSSLLGLMAEKISPRAQQYLDGNPETAIAALKESWIEPGLATEQILWLENLIEADPTSILPVTVGVMTFLTIWVGTGSHRALQKNDPNYQLPFLARVIRNGMLGFAVCIPGLTLNVPSGIMLYWLSSTTSAFLINVLLDTFQPLHMPPKPCKGAPVLPKS
ncbi:hypothetical protein M501DRAFT_930036 [Patellaria atrata CBS 101060]|uniref:Mitochondrial export translocase Oxa2 n=1 Tax=Patellaria atrata CBS 101060 TaxID=1346257 RepID=A0A9P4SFB8_9PEZI|nr:hypothetical protein M501DRAFT_930036 [Patellaria atrata CBS 101060]